MYQVDAAATDVCNGGADFICDWVYDVTGNETFAEALDWIVERPLKVIVILLVAWAAQPIGGACHPRGEERMVCRSRTEAR